MIWFLLNTAARLRFAWRRPRYALRSLLREITLADERFLAPARGADLRDIRRFIGEPSKARDLLEHLRRCEPRLREAQTASADLYAKRVLIQYASARALHPQVVDSLHTYEHMRWEFEPAYPHIRPNGLLIADDVLWNPAFADFALEVGCPAASIVRGVGILRKQ